MDGKRSNPVHNTPRKALQKRTKEKEPTICLVCNLTITESNNQAVGEDAIYCVGDCLGDCEAWIHRKYIGMSDQLTYAQNNFRYHISQ